MTYVIISNKILKVSINFLNRGLAHSINKCRKQNKATQTAFNGLATNNTQPPYNLHFKKEHDHRPGCKVMLCHHTVYGRPQLVTSEQTIFNRCQGSAFPRPTSKP